MEAFLTVLSLALGVVVIALAARLRATRHEPPQGPAPAGNELRSQIEGLELERRRVQEILESMEEGVLVLDESLSPTLVNAAARRLLEASAPGSSARPMSPEVESAARRALSEGSGVEDVAALWPSGTRLRVRAIPLQEQNGVIVVLKDVTEDLRTQQMRREFVANASHELKSPIAGLRALAEAIQEASEDDPAAATRFADRLVGETERLGRLIGDLLDLSRLEDAAGGVRSAVDLSHVAASEAAEAAPVAESKGVALVTRIPPGLVVRGDDQHLRLLVRNLLDNAVRYTPEGGTVEIELTSDGGTAVVTVGDDGIGIPSHAQRRIFERFYRVDGDRSRERGGTGLGLAIVKHVVELHGGHVALDSELGRGSTFTVHLPGLVEKATRGTERPEMPVARRT